VTMRTRREGLDVDAVELLVDDMRSPLQVLVSHLEVLRRQLRGENARDIDAALSGVRSLRRMTNSLLDVSRLEAGRLAIRPTVTSLSALAHDVVLGIHLVQPTCDIAVETRGESLCLCDPQVTRRVIENLVSNAMKVTPIDGRIRVVIGGQYTATISVADEGLAVPPEERDRIFEPFCADRPQRIGAEEASGLGLAFCKLAVEAQGGSIRIEDGAPRGNVFVVELPR
jgi:two-component system sensor histidine kinase/response regulator